MAKTDANDQPSGRTADHKKRHLMGKSIGGVAIIVLVGIYAVARPSLNQRFGLDLPDVRTDSQGQVTVKDSAPSGSKSVPTLNDSNPSGSKSTPEAKPKDDRSTAPRQSPASTKSAAGSATASDAKDLLYGLLKEVAKDRYVSPAGLQYTPGSQEGHRLEHLRRHTQDDPGRPGSHGVFDGGMEQALQTIDKAYDRAKKGERTTKEVDGDRTVYTVDMGGRVGFVGGKEGQRKRNPMARRVRLVLEGTRVITAYPM